MITFRNNEIIFCNRWEHGYLRLILPNTNQHLRNIYIIFFEGEFELCLWPYKQFTTVVVSDSVCWLLTETETFGVFSSHSPDDAKCQWSVQHQHHNTAQSHCCRCSFNCVLTFSFTGSIPCWEVSQRIPAHIYAPSQISGCVCIIWDKQILTVFSLCPKTPTLEAERLWVWMLSVTLCQEVQIPSAPKSKKKPKHWKPESWSSFI